jgi:hypothetical protein
VIRAEHSVVCQEDHIVVDAICHHAGSGLRAECAVCSHICALKSSDPRAARKLGRLTLERERGGRVGFETGCGVVILTAYAAARGCAVVTVDDGRVAVIHQNLSRGDERRQWHLVLSRR